MHPDNNPYLVNICYDHYLSDVLYQDDTMFSLKNHQYVALDFETTGLDHELDEPIQSAWIRFDHNFSVVQEYNSYICPERPLDQLSQTVTRLTGIDHNQLRDAPRIQTICQQMRTWLED